MNNLELKSIERCAEILEGETFEYSGAECVVVSDAEECYRLGYNDAVDNVCQWLKNWACFSVDETTGTINENDLIERLRKGI